MRLRSKKEQGILLKEACIGCGHWESNPEPVSRESIPHSHYYAIQTPSAYMPLKLNKLYFLIFINSLSENRICTIHGGFPLTLSLCKLFRRVYRPGLCAEGRLSMMGSKLPASKIVSWLLFFRSRSTPCHEGIVWRHMIISLKLNCTISQYHNQPLYHSYHHYALYFIEHCIISNTAECAIHRNY